MIRPFHVLGHAVRLWWQEWIGLMFLNILWVLLQIPIVTGPPATAVLYALTQRIHDGELWDLQDTWQLLRELFWHSWRWALPNLVTGLILILNLLLYQDATGLLWIALRVVWILLLMAWWTLNLFYWPFWLAQEERSLRTTYGNCGRFVLLNPLPTLIISFVCGLVAAVSVVLVLPLMIGVVCWLALVGTTAVQRSLAHQREKPAP